MSGKTLAIAVAAIGWLLASLCAFVLLTLVGFFGIGLVGLLVWFICTRLELEADSSDGLFARQFQARQALSRAERAAGRHERALAGQSTRVFKTVSIGLTVIGFGGFLYFQL